MTRARHEGHGAFHQRELPRLVEELDLIASPSDRGFLVRDGDRVERVLEVPPCLPVPREGMTGREYLEALPPHSQDEIIGLFRAGETALGLWEEGRLVRHKMIRKYVVRGRGKAQVTYLETRGKSRYGSRLRLQNHRAWIRETQDLITSWLEERTRPIALFFSCPQRLRSSLYAPDLPLIPVDAIHWIPLHVHHPRMRELERIHHVLHHGRLRARRELC